MDRKDTIGMTAEIVSAYVSGNQVAAEELPGLINQVFNTLAQAGQPQPVVEAQEPAVPIKKSVARDHLVCLECGKRVKMLKRHLRTEHDLTPADYKAKWSLPSDYPLVAPAYAEQRSDLAKQSGLGRRPKAEEKPAPTRRRKKTVA